jgi:hypothetical protein
MHKAKKKRLESKGWRFGSVKEFLSLSDEEAAYIELKTASRGTSRWQKAPVTEIICDEDVVERGDEHRGRQEPRA